MRTHSEQEERTRRPRFAGGRAARCCMLVLLLASVSFLPVQAETLGDLYEASVPLTGAGPTALDEAFARALGMVLVKVTGRRTMGESELAGDATSMVRQYQPLAGGRIRVQFDPLAVRRRLDRAGLPIWGADRPVTLVWLRLADGVLRAGELPDSPSATLPAEAASPAARLRAELLRAAALRGVPIRLPTESAIQAGRAVPADLGGADAVLEGTPGADGSYTWTLTAPAAGINGTWRGDPAAGVDGLADRLAARYAAAVTAIQQWRMQVSGVRSFAGFSRLQAALAGMEEVEGASIEQVRGDVLEYRLTVRGDQSRLRELLSRESVLVPELPDEASDSAGVLRYRLAADAP